MKGTKSTLDNLTGVERRALALWYDTESHKALVKLISLERLELAKDHVDETDMSVIRYLSGQVRGLKKLAGTIRENYKNSIKAEDSKKKKG